MKKTTSTLLSLAIILSVCACAQTPLESRNDLATDSTTTAVETTAPPPEAPIEEFIVGKWAGESTELEFYFWFNPDGTFTHATWSKEYDEDFAFDGEYSILSQDTIALTTDECQDIYQYEFENGNFIIAFILDEPTIYKKVN